MRYQLGQGLTGLLLQPAKPVGSERLAPTGSGGLDFGSADRRVRNLGSGGLLDLGSGGLCANAPRISTHGKRYTRCMGHKWKTCGATALAVLLLLGLMVLTIWIVSKRGQLEEEWSVQIPGAGVSGKGPNGLPISGGQLYDDDSILVDTFLKRTPQLIGLDGQVRWEFKPHIAGDLAMSTVVGTDGSLYIGTDQNKVYAFDAQQQLRWVTPVLGDHPWICAPVLAPDGSVYVEADEGYLYKFDADGKEIWNVKIDGIGRGRSQVVDQAGIVYATTNQYELVAISADGKELWRTAETIGSPPLIITSDGGILSINDYLDEIRMFNQDGSQRWAAAATPPSGVFIGDWWAAVAPDDTVIYVTEALPGRSVINACDTNGNVKWTYSHRRLVCNPMVLPDGRLVFFEDNAAGFASANKAVMRFNSLNQKLTGYFNCGLLVLNPDGTLDAHHKLGFLITTLPPMVRSNGELLLTDEKGVMHAYLP